MAVGLDEELDKPNSFAGRKQAEKTGHGYILLAKGAKEEEGIIGLPPWGKWKMSVPYACVRQSRLFP